MLSAALLGTRFETLPPLAISFKPFQFLKSLGLNSIGLGFDCVPFHSGWELVEWRSKLHVLESNYAKILEICEEIEEEEPLEVFGPQIELNLKNPTDVSEPLVEVAGVAPTVGVEVEEESSVEVLEARTSVEKMRDQAVRIGVEPVLIDVEEVRIGDEPVLEVEEMRTVEEPVPADVEMGTGDIPCLLYTSPSPRD